MTTYGPSPDGQSHRLQAAQASSTEILPELIPPLVVAPISDEIFHHRIAANLSDAVMVGVTILFISEVILNWSH